MFIRAWPIFYIVSLAIVHKLSIYSADTRWIRFTGGLSGLWTGYFDPNAPLNDLYLLSHNSSTQVLLPLLNRVFIYSLRFFCWTGFRGLGHCEP